MLTEASFMEGGVRTPDKLQPSTKTGSSQSSFSSHEHITFLNVISDQKFPVFLVYSKHRSQHCVLKAFPAQGKQALQYDNEARFSFLSHQNIIKTLSTGQNKMIVSDDMTVRVSFILMELAPYGDFFDLVKSHQNILCEKLVRTYFRQLIEGLNYLHSKGVYHMDIKLENLLIGADYVLKIADFDLSCFASDSEIISQGTMNFRAPEVVASRCEDGAAADIFSAGVVLFVLRSRGMVPFSEEENQKNDSFFELIQQDQHEFWKRHCQLQGRNDSDFSEEFKELFTQMVKENPEERISMKEIQESKWYNGDVFSAEELSLLLKPFVKPQKY